MEQIVKSGLQTAGRPQTVNRRWTNHRGWFVNSGLTYQPSPADADRGCCAHTCQRGHAPNNANVNINPSHRCYDWII